MSIQTDAQTRYDVVIVGAGPAGLMLAGELAAAGLHPAVVERAASPAELPKANGVVGRAAVELRRRGILSGTGHRVVRAPRFRFGPLTLNLGLLLSPLHVLPIPQRRLEELLEHRARRLGAAILRGHEMTAFEQDDDTVTIHTTAEGSAVVLTARYVVGCDGARSMVRKRLGIDFPGETSSGISRIARVTIPATCATRARDALEIHGVGTLALFRPNRTEHGSMTIAPADALDRAAAADLFIVSTHEPRGDADPTDALSEDELRASLRRVLGTDLPFTNAHAARSIVANSRQAERYRSGRVFLAGDAAHLFGAGGSAINVGLLDAIALAETLDAVLRGDADENVLDSFHTERHAAGRRALAHTRVQLALDEGGQTGDALREVLGRLLKDRATARRIARLIEG